MEIKLIDEDRKPGYWKGKTGLGEQSKGYCKEFFNTLSELDSMLDGNIERISIANH